MNILVTGAAGFLGSHLVDRLQRDHTVYALCHDKEPIWSRYRVVTINGDVTNAPRMLEIVNDCEVEQIYHCAAKSVVRNCNNDPIGCFKTNVLGTATILEAARQTGNVQGVMCMESDKSYGPGEVPYKEDQPLNPRGIYEASKACSGYVAKSYWANYGVPVFTIRSANVYGPGDRNYTRLVPNTIRRVLNSKPPQITEGAGGYTREFIYASDWVDVAISLMQLGPWGDAINVGSGQLETVAGIVRKICEMLGLQVELKSWPKPQDLTEIPNQCLDTSKLRKLVAMDYVSLDQGLQATIDWYKRNTE